MLCFMAQKVRATLPMARGLWPIMFEAASYTDSCGKSQFLKEAKVGHPDLNFAFPQINMERRAKKNFSERWWPRIKFNF